MHVATDLAAVREADTTAVTRAADATRLFYVDVARIVAVLGVIAIHNWSLLHVLDVGTTRWWATDVVFTASRWAVPVFVMISGGLLLRRAAEGSAADFYRRRLGRVGLPAAFWIGAYLLFRATFLEQHLTVQEIANDIVMATPFVHLYFLYVIIGLYLIAPLLGPWVRGASRSTLLMSAAALLALPALESLFRLLLDTGGGGVTGLTYWFPFLGYFVAGAALTGLDLGKPASFLLLGAIPVVIALQVLAVYVLASADLPHTYPTGYFSVFTIAAAWLIYALAARKSDGQHRSGLAQRVVANLGAATFGVYLFHEMLLHWHARTFVHGSPEELVVARIPTYVFAVLGSFVLVLVGRRTPLLRRVL